MKLQAQAIVGFVAGAVIAIGVLLITPPKTPYYYIETLDGNLLKSLYNSPNFSTLTLNFNYNSSTQKFELLPTAVETNGNSITLDPKILLNSTRGKSIAGSRTLVPYNLQNNNVSGLLQLKTLVGIVTSNPGCYFTLTPDDYVTIDPSDRTHIYYQIVAYDKNNNAIDVREINPLAFQLNPSPPSRLY